MRIVRTTLLALILMAAAACSSNNSNSTTAPNGPLTGNWQFNLSQEQPPPATALSVSGFLQESGTSVAGSVSVPTDPTGNCGGVVSLTGSTNGQNISFSIDQNGTVLNFTGAVDYSSGSMSGSYAGEAGTCFSRPTTGTWTAVQVPSISGSFTGNLSDSEYMLVLTGLNPPTPIPISGTLTQSASANGSNASVTGTITATGYPCFNTATLVGTISGQNLYLAVYSYTGEEIGSLGIVGDAATVTSDSSGISLSGKLTLGGIAGSGEYGPCPAIENGLVQDSANACLAIGPQTGSVCSGSTNAAPRSGK